MGKVWVKELTGGLDTRRLPETTPGGVLIKALDGHINSGGEFEKRAAFVAAYTLPDGTVGLAADAASLIVFGNATDPGVPPGVAYQKLEKSTKTLVDVPSYDLYGGDVYAVAEYDDGTIAHFFDGAEVTDWFDGRARASFEIISGTDAVDSLDMIYVNGVAIMSAAEDYDTNNETTAAAIAANINAHTSSPDYNATSVGARVNIIAATSGAASNGFGVSFKVDTAFVLSDYSPTLANGANSAAFVPGEFVKTVGSKMYAVSGSSLHYSGIREPTKWTTDTTGAGFTDVSKEASGAEDLLALADYQGFVAVFAETVILTFFVDPDPDLVAKRQVLRNTGTVAPRSVTEFGDSDVFYLALSGLRSLRARDSSNSASTTDLGVPVDSLIKAKLAVMTPDERKGVIGLINPVDGRFWLIFPDGEIFVFSYYSNSKVSAWTTYETGFTVDKAIVFGRRVFLRSGNTIYVYGGLDNAATLTYDSTVAKAWLPYFDAGKPTEQKQWAGIDAAVSGTWAVYVAPQPTNLDARELVANLTETTFNNERVPFNGKTTHASPQFESSGEGEAVLSAIVLHYEGGEDG